MLSMWHTQQAKLNMSDYEKQARFMPVDVLKATHGDKQWPLLDDCLASEQVLGRDQDVALDGVVSDLD